MPEARYDGSAAWYDRLAGEFTQPFARTVAARTAGYAERGDVVLDVGCGTGLGFDALRGPLEHPPGRREAMSA
jgi:ubiquinone/menaquinone biosynthesis C-methylase UbiE